MVLMVTAAPAPATHGFDKDCGDFATQAAAQYHLNAHPGDPDGLDGDRDAIACESNKCPCYRGTATGPEPVYALPTATPTPAATTAPQPIVEPARPVTYRARVVTVVDGDTLRVRLRSGRRRTVRLIGIDTPEAGKPGVGVECGARRATAHMKKLALRRRRGQAVRLRTDPTQDRTDRFGRTLAYVTRVSGGLDLGRAMVSAGWAEPFVFGNRPFQRLAAYTRSASQARTAARGVHKLCGGDFHSEQP